MDDYVSVSKGIFTFAPYVIGKRKKVPSNQDNDSVDLNSPWYLAYKQNWTEIENIANRVHYDMFNQIIQNLKNYVDKIRLRPLKELNNEISTAILLTGVNLPDHSNLFEKIVSQLRENNPYIAETWSREASNLKNLTEAVVFKLVNSTIQNEDDITEVPLIKKNQCTFSLLSDWHNENSDSEIPFIILLPDFESFSPQVLQDFIKIVSCYACTMKFIFIFGIATTLHAVHRTFVHGAISKLNIKVFKTETESKSLYGVLDAILSSPKIPFKLIGKTFPLLTEIFLYYDFSIDVFLKSYKLCMFLHFFNNDLKALCCTKEKISQALESLEFNDDVKNYLKKWRYESYNNEETKEYIRDGINKFHNYLDDFLTVLRCFHKFIEQLPSTPYDRSKFYGLYADSIGKDSITNSNDYKDLIKLIHSYSKEEFVNILHEVSTILEYNKSLPKNIVGDIQEYIDKIKDASTDIQEVADSKFSLQTAIVRSRSQLRQTLFQNASTKLQSPYKTILIEFMDYLSKNVFSKYLKPPNSIPFNDIFCYNNPRIKSHICGPLRAEIENCLRNPAMFLGCSCCQLKKEESYTKSFPDLNLVYALHLESVKRINVYDWFQAYLSVLEQSVDRDEDIDPELKERFTRSVAYLEVLGYIKSILRSTDYVKKLT